jgi:hypothetical protein
MRAGVAALTAALFSMAVSAEAMMRPPPPLEQAEYAHFRPMGTVFAI